ncbi:MAG TPA: diphthamide biosynthesis enzyme Dph2 [Thermoplasmata archaeon]|nr:diphthamide biosynthesis enzyme Dph2 [Thermoplasmata archaeon]
MDDSSLPMAKWAPARAEAGQGYAPAGQYARFDSVLFEALRRAGHRRLALQLPAGLVRNGADLAAQLSEATGARVDLASRSCFGACDVPERGEVPGAEAAVVLGHAPIPNIRLPLPTYFVEMREAGGNPARLAEIVRAAGLPRRLGLLASIQHLDLVPPLVEELRNLGWSLRTAPGDGRLAYDAQALGCNYSPAEKLEPEVDGFLFLGTGTFHPRGLALATRRPVWPLDPLREELEPPMDRDRIVRERLIRVALARDAKRWGILVSSFAGQFRGAMAESLRLRAEARGRSATVVAFGRLDPADLAGRAFDAYVNTACPRIATDDAASYERPVLTPPEFLMAIGDEPLETYRFDTFR